MSTTGWIVLGVLAVLVIWAISIYNRLVAMRQRVSQSFADIDVQLKQRHDLIPNLVETVKGYASHERGTLEAVVQARNAAIAAPGIEQKVAAENMLTGALRQLFAVAEAYPDLKANQNFLQLQEELTGTESRIAFSRQFYNEQVLAYDNALEQFPSNVIAGMFNFEPKVYFEAEDAARTAPKVDFGSTPPGSGPGAPPMATGPEAGPPPGGDPVPGAPQAGAPPAATTPPSAGTPPTDPPTTT